jgi:putative ABC transport system permease protein
LEEAVAFTLLPQRLAASLSGSLGIVGLLLATMGIYGVTAFAVAQRTREIGIRMALGATQAAVVGMVLRFGLKLVAGGAVVGLLFAAALNAILTKVFFGFPPIDAVAFAASATLFLLVGMTACFVPVRRAMRIDPLVVLRYE